MAIVTASNPANVKLKELLSTVGKAGVHALFPNDFEAYFISFELVDSKGATEAFITFPVQPDSISESISKITNIKKTAGGVVSIGTETFVPIPLEIKGNFGRNFKFTIGNTFLQGGLFQFIKDGGLNDENIERPSFSNKVKTGYGMIKAIEAVFNAADTIDKYDRPKKLYFYNTILGNNYIVKPMNFTHSQNSEANMIPQYNIQMTAVAPMNSSASDEIKKLGKAMGLSILNRQADSVARGIKGKLGL